jgi:hypothetical protein
MLALDQKWQKGIGVVLTNHCPPSRGMRAHHPLKSTPTIT